MLNRLLASHRSIEATAAQLAMLLDHATPDIERLMAARWELATRMMQHLALEDRHVYANLAASDDPQSAAIGRRYQQVYAEHLENYATHARQWTNERIVAEWSRYRDVTREQLRLLQERIDLVEHELYPLATTEIDVDQRQQPSRSWARAAFDLKDVLASGTTGRR